MEWMVKDIWAGSNEKDDVKRTMSLRIYLKYLIEVEKILENQQVIKTPVVRNGKQSTLGYQPDVWKEWN